MSLDARARSAVHELRTTAPPAADTEARLRRIPERIEARGRQRWAALAVAFALVVAAAAGFGLGRVAPGAVIEPGAGPTPSPTYTRCGSSTVICLGGRSYRVTLPIPVTLRLPESFQDDAVNDVMLNVEVYNGGDTRAGVTIMEAALPVLADGSAAPDVTLSAKEIATWLSTRPFVLPTTVRPAYVGGLDGYRVDVAVRPGAELPGQKAGQVSPVAFTFESAGWTSAVSTELHHASYYVLDAPRGDLVVIWSWTNGGSSSEITSNQRLIDTIEFG